MLPFAVKGDEVRDSRLLHVQPRVTVEGNVTLYIIYKEVDMLSWSGIFGCKDGTLTLLLKLAVKHTLRKCVFWPQLNEIAGVPLCCCHLIENICEFGKNEHWFFFYWISWLTNVTSCSLTSMTSCTLWPSHCYVSAVGLVKLDES